MNEATMKRIIIVFVVAICSVLATSYALKDWKPEGNKTKNTGDDVISTDDVFVTVRIEAGQGGTIPAGLDKEINGVYKQGEKIKLIARCNMGYVFSHWETSGTSECINDPKKYDAELTVPSENIIVRAVFTRYTDIEND